MDSFAAVGGWLFWQAGCFLRLRESGKDSPLPDDRRDAGRIGLELARCGFFNRCIKVFDCLCDLSGGLNIIKKSGDLPAV